MESSSLLRTPLYNEHLTLGAKIVPFAGWEMPVQYSGVIAEHVAVRERGGLFDVSHMGEIFCEGKEAEAALQYLTTNDVAKLVDGKAQYSAIADHNGGVVDDIIVYRFSRERFLICVNASNSDADFAWFTKHNRHAATFINRSNEFGQIAVQGPVALELVAEVLGVPVSDLPKSFFFTTRQYRGAELIIARTGYTGEDGVEVFLPAGKTAELWRALVSAGAPRGVIPAGLGARDSLRLEACLPLHGHELGRDISAVESGIGWVVKTEKGEFIGSGVLVEQKAHGAPRRLVGFIVEDQGIARHGDLVFNKEGKKVGVVTSGTKTPTVNRALGLALVSSEVSKVDAELSVEVRGRKLRARTVATPFYRRASAATVTK